MHAVAQGVLRTWAVAVLAAVLTWGCVGIGGGAAFPNTPDKDYDALGFPRPTANFALYQTRVDDLLAQRSLPGRQPAEQALNRPFESAADPNVAYRGRFLLFHGLNDSAYVWRDLSASLNRLGFDTRAVLFSGHGTTPADMLDVDHQEWLASAAEHLAVWSEPGVPMYLGGFSMGATLATWLALQDPDGIDGLLLISPAYRSSLNHLLRWAGIYRHIEPWVFGGMILEDNPMKYNSIPVNSGWQFFQTTRRLRMSWGRQTLDMPVLMVLTDNDSVVDVPYAARVFEDRFTHPDKRLLRYHSGPNRQQGAVQWRDARDPARRILNQSHLGLMYRPDNPLFGEDGRVLVCNGNEFPIFMACMRAQNHWYGAQHTESPDGTPVARTTYNPDFQTLERALRTQF